MVRNTYNSKYYQIMKDIIKGLICVLSFLITSNVMGQQISRTEFNVGSNINKPVTVKTNKGTYTVYSSMTIEGVANVQSATDAEGNKIVVSSSYKSKSGQDHGKHYSYYTRIYNFNTLWYKPSTNRSSTSSSSRVGYSSSYGKYIYQQKRDKKWASSDELEDEDEEEEEEDDDDDTPAPSYIDRRSNHPTSYGYNDPPRDNQRVEIYYNNMQVLGPVKSLEMKYWLAEQKGNGKVKNTDLSAYEITYYDKWGRMLSQEENYTSGKKVIPSDKYFLYRNGSKRLGTKSKWLCHWNELNKEDMWLHYDNGVMKSSCMRTYDINGNCNGEYHYAPNGDRGLYSQTEYTQDGKCIRSLSAGQLFGTFTEKIYDEQGRLRYVDEFNSDSTLIQHYSYFYDSRGNCIKQSFDIEGNRIYKEWEYDSNNNVSVYKDHTYGFGELKVETYERDGQGNIIKITEKVGRDPERVSETRNYDAEGRPTEVIEYTNYGTYVTHTEYDSQGRIHIKKTVYQDSGKTRECDTYTYDAYGNVIEKLNEFDGRFYRTEYKYTYWE